MAQWAGDDRRKGENSDDHRSERRPVPDLNAAVWVRWASVIMLGLALSSLGFVVQLSNRMTAVEVKMEQAQQQRTELNQVIQDLHVRMGQLDATMIRLTNELQQLEREAGRPARMPGRMFDK